MHNNTPSLPSTATGVPSTHHAIQSYRAWWETILLTCLSFAPLCAWILLFEPRGQYLLFWACLTPLLLTSFHGTVFGLTSLVMTIIFLASGLPLVVQILTAFDLLNIDRNILGFKLPLPAWSGVALWLFCVGECRRFWRKKAIIAEAKLQKTNQRLERFSRNYQLLKASHDQLAHASTEITPHVRGAVKKLKQLAANTPAPRLRHIGKSVLEIFTEFGSLQCAGLYAFHDDTLTLCQSTGVNHQLEQKDPMLREALETGALQFVSGKMRSSHSQYQLCIPFCDSSGKIQAVIAAESVRFFALNADHLSLLAVLAHVCADLLNDALLATVLEEHQEHIFRQKISAYKSSAEQYAIPTCFATLEITANASLAATSTVNESATPGISTTDTLTPDTATHQAESFDTESLDTETLQTHQYLRDLTGIFRDTDTLWFHGLAKADTAQTETPALSVLMPMTTIEEAQLAIQRVESYLNAMHNDSAIKLETRELKAL